MTERDMPTTPFILIVEDCDEAVAALQIALETFYRCRVTHAPDGASGLAVLADRLHPPLAVITDLNLPGVDGYRLIEWMRCEPVFARTPVIVISADTGPGVAERACALGADAFFAKPYSPTGVCLSLEKILDAKQKLDPLNGFSSGVDGANRG